MRDNQRLAANSALFQPRMNTSMEITPAKFQDTSISIYEFGCRLDKDCQEAVWDQIQKSRLLYNDLVAIIRGVVEELQAFVLEKSGSEAQALHATIEGLNVEFAAAKAIDDEAAMKVIAEVRRGKWKELGEKLREARKIHRTEIASRFLSRIGRNSSCDTYVQRCKAVANGLGWATANAVLEAALIAFKKSFALGRAPRFSVGEEKDQDCLTLQFTMAGGVSVGSLLGGSHSELSLLSPPTGSGRRSYGEFKFRLGAAKDKSYATGTWQYHRPLPEGCTIGLARLVRRRIGKDTRYAIQLMVKNNQTDDQSSRPARKPLLAVHFGWATDISGRRVAGLADSADPGNAVILHLPPAIEETLQRAADIQGLRDNSRDEITPKLKQISLPENLEPDFAEEWASFKRLPVTHVSSNRLHRLCRRLREKIKELPDWLEAWRLEDRMRWQSHTHLAKRARNARKTFYREQAARMARSYSTIAIEHLDLAAAAKKVDESTGDKNDLSRKARAGRVVAAIYELESALRWAAAKHGCVVVEATGKTASCCSICGGIAESKDDDLQVLSCSQCGAQVDRKQNGAAVVYQAVEQQFESLVEDYWLSALSMQNEKLSATALKKQKLKEGRAKARTSSADTIDSGYTT